jgi:hypothetical protein
MSDGHGEDIVAMCKAVLEWDGLRHVHNASGACSLSLEFCVQFRNSDNKQKLKSVLQIIY